MCTAAGTTHCLGLYEPELLNLRNTFFTARSAEFDVRLSRPQGEEPPAVDARQRFLIGLVTNCHENSDPVRPRLPNALTVLYNFREPSIVPPRG